MPAGLIFDPRGGLWDGQGRRFDAWNWSWRPGGEAPQGAVPVSESEALRRICTELGARRVPVGVIGPREATAGQVTAAGQVGKLLAAHGLTLVCGGRGGVMAAAAEGARQAGGLTIGLLPGSDWREANAGIEIPIATGLSEGRNMVIAKSCAALVAVGGSYGTLSEVAYGLHFDKPVFGLAGAPDVPGVIPAAAAEEILPPLARYLIFGAKPS